MNAQPTLPPEVTLGPRTSFRAGAGEAPVQAIITVTNRSRLLERYIITVAGLPDEWATLGMSELRLEPGQSSQVPLRISTQASPEHPAGDYPFRVRVAPFSFPESFAEVGGNIAMSGTAAFDARLTPQQVEGRKEKFKLTLRNTGGLPLSLLLEASDMEGMCSFEHPAPPTLEPGQETVVPIWVGARRNGLVGLPKRLDFRVRVAPAGATSNAARSFDARFVHSPFLSPRLTSMGALAAVLIMVIGLAISVGKPGLTSAFNTVRCKVGDEELDLQSNKQVVLEQCGGLPYEDQIRLQASAGNTTPTATGAAGTPTTTAATATVAAQATATPVPQPVVRKITVNKTLASGNLSVQLKTVEVLPDNRVRFDMHVKNNGADAGWLEDKMGLTRAGGPFVQTSAGTKLTPDEWGTLQGPRALGDQLPIARNAEADVFVIYPAFDATKPFSLMDDVLFDNLTIAGPTSLSIESPGVDVRAAAGPAEPAAPSSGASGSSNPGANSGANVSGGGNTTAPAQPPTPAARVEPTAVPAPPPPPPPVVQQEPPPPPPAPPVVPAPPVTLTGALADAVKLINDYRVANGRQALRVNGLLVSAAGGYANVLASQNFFSHYGLDGSTPQGRTAASGYAGFMSGEVLSAGANQNVALNAVNNWKNSPEHNAILLNPDAVEIGIGLGFSAGSTYKYYWIAITGIP